MQFATAHASLLYGQFRKTEADDPEVFSAAVVRIFSGFSPDVVRYVVDPLTGLAGKSKWLPTISEVKEACDERAGFLARQVQREFDEIAAEARRKKDAEDNRKLNEDRKTRRNYDEMKTDYGSTWGLSQGTKSEEAEKARRAKLDDMARANRTILDREFAAAGIKDEGKIPISPELRAFGAKAKAELDEADARDLQWQAERVG